MGHFCLPGPESGPRNPIETGPIGIRIRIRNIGYKKAKINYHKITYKDLTVPLHLSALKSLMNSAPRRGNIVGRGPCFFCFGSTPPPQQSQPIRSPSLPISEYFFSLCSLPLTAEWRRGSVKQIRRQQKNRGLLPLCTSALFSSVHHSLFSDVRSRDTWRFQVVENRSRTM